MAIGAAPSRCSRQVIDGIRYLWVYPENRKRAILIMAWLILDFFIGHIGPYPLPNWPMYSPPPALAARGKRQQHLLFENSVTGKGRIQRLLCP